MTVASESGSGARAGGSARRVTVGRVAVRVVAAALFASVLWLAIANMIGVTTTLTANNTFLRENGGAALQTAIPWPALVLDVLIAPVGYVVAWVVSRRMDLRRMLVVFLVAFAAVATLWFDILQYVSATLRVGG